MKRPVLTSPMYLRALKRLLKKQRSAAGPIRLALERLAEDAFHPRLRTHKLKGDLQEYHACSAGFDLRIIFQLTPHEEGGEAILLHTVGSHEEVY